MWQNLTHFDVAPLNLAIRALAVYVAILFLLRISGKRQLGQMNAGEFVVILLISNAVQNSMNGGDNSLVGGLVLAAVLIGVSSIISLLAYRSPLISSLVEGVPSLLVHKGKLIQKHLRKERMTEAELKVLLRKQGFHHFKEIEAAILEADGTLSVIRQGEPPVERI